MFLFEILERARRFERPTPTLARLCSTPELRPLMTRSVGNSDRLPRLFGPDRRYMAQPAFKCNREFSVKCTISQTGLVCGVCAAGLRGRLVRFRFENAKHCADLPGCLSRAHIRRMTSDRHRSFASHNRIDRSIQQEWIPCQRPAKTFLIALMRWA